MNMDLSLARKELVQGQDALVVVKSGEVVHRASGKGINPLFRAVTEHSALLQDSVLSDRVIGRGAALLVRFGGIRAVFAEVFSERACELLDGKVDYLYEHKVPVILSRTGSDLCPVEALTENIHDPEIGYQLIEEFLKRPKA